MRDVKLFAIFLGFLSALIPLKAEMQSYPVFDVRGDLAYVQVVLTPDSANKSIGLYRPGVKLPNAGAAGKKTTELLLGTAKVFAIEADYAVLKIPPELAGQIKKGDVARVEVALPAPTQTPTTAPEPNAAPEKSNYIFGTGNGFTGGGSPSFLMAALGYERLFQNKVQFANITFETLGIELRSMVVNADRTAVGLMYRMSFIANKFWVLNGGAQVGLNGEGPRGGGLIGIGLLVPGTLRLEGNFEGLNATYTDGYFKLSVFINSNFSFLMQSGVFGIYTRAARIDTNTYTGTMSIHNYDKVSNVAYFTVGFAYQNPSNLTVALRGGLSGEKSSAFGASGRIEFGLMF